MNPRFFGVRSLLPFLALSAAVYAQPTIAGKATEKISVCHANGTKHNPLSVTLNALEAHLAHGDVLQPNGVVPGSPGFVFDSNCSPVTWTYAVNADPDLAAEDPLSPGNLHVGSGIPAENFGLVRNELEGIELGLMVLYRQGPTVTTTDDYADGVLNFNVASGPQSTANGSFADNAGRAAWNFTFSVVTGLNGPQTLADYTLEILYDVDPGPGVSYRTLTGEQVVAIPVAPKNGYGWRDQDLGITIGDDEGTNRVTQNSQNYGFGQYQVFLTAPYGPGNNFAGPAKFDFVLRALKSGQIVGSNHISVNVAP